MKTNNKTLISEKTIIIQRKLANILIFFIILLVFFLPYVQLKAAESSELFLNIIYIRITGLYITVIFSIIFYRDFNLLHLDKIALWMITASCFIRVGYNTNTETIYRLFFMLLGSVLVVFLVKNRINTRIPKLKHFFISLTWGMGTVLLVVLLLSDFPIKGYYNHSTEWLFSTLMLNFSFVTIIEEAVFRGLLVGLLVIKGVKKDTAFIIQGILFWAVHYWSASNLILFFVALPIITLSTTLIVRKYKMLSLSIIIHTLVNILPHYLVDF